MVLKYKNKEEYLKRIEKFYSSNLDCVIGYLHECLLREILDKFELKNKRILDVGCGFGNLIGEIKKIYPKNEFYGVDISRKNIKIARKNVRGVKFSVSDAEILGFKDSYFDILFCGDTIEHVYNIENALSEFNRVLKKNSLLVICVPNYFNLIGIIKLFLERLYICKKDSFSINLFKQENEKFVTFYSLKKNLEKNNFRVESVKPFNIIQGFMPYYDIIIHKLCLLYDSERFRFFGELGSQLYSLTIKINRYLEKIYLSKSIASQVIYTCKKVK